MAENNSGWIYILSDQQGHYKIGKAKELTARVKQIRLLLPFPVEIWLAFPVENRHEAEARLHESLAYYRVNGEWFAVPPSEDYVLLVESLNIAEMNAALAVREREGCVIPFSLDMYASCRPQDPMKRMLGMDWLAGECVKRAMADLPFDNFVQAQSYLTPQLTPLMGVSL